MWVTIIIHTSRQMGLVYLNQIQSPSATQRSLAVVFDVTLLLRIMFWSVYLHEFCPPRVQKLSGKCTCETFSYSFSTCCILQLKHVVQWISYARMYFDRKRVVLFGISELTCNSTTVGNGFYICELYGWLYHSLVRMCHLRILILSTVLSPHFESSLVCTSIAPFCN